MKDIIIDGGTANRAKNSFWRGFGFISANNSSRLLLDYKREHPEVYRKLLKWMFDPKEGLGMTHLKLEMGADINSSSGTEPSTKRSADEPANVLRGAGFALAADAVKINPDLNLELLSWGVPGYIHNAPEEEKFPLRYQWFKQTLDAAYRVWGLKFKFIDPNINERVVEREWIKYFSRALKAETDCHYPYKDIRIVIADEEAHFNAALDMLNDPELMEAVDVVGVHYISRSDENTQRCKREFGKELWYSEGLSPANVPELTVRADGSGLRGVNSLLDVAGRIVNMYPTGGYTLYEFQPAIAAYYSGVNYFPKQLIRANEPWSGHIKVDAGMAMAQHFALFAKKGWLPVESACFGDGEERDHVLLNTNDNYLTLCDPAGDDYSAVLVNHSNSERSYRVTVRGLAGAGRTVHLWETRGPDSGAIDENWFKHIGDIEPVKTSEGFSYEITVKPNSMLTVSTLEVTPLDLSDDTPAGVMPLPYRDDFTGEDISLTGGTPRYTTDQGGAFEVIPDPERGQVLCQMITPHTKGSEWGYTPNPVTSLGDDLWANYSVSAEVKLVSGNSDNYAGIGLRYINAAADNSMSGYRLQLTGDGRWQLMRIRELLAEGVIEGFAPGRWYLLSLTADGDRLSCSVEGRFCAELTLSGEMTFSGRAAFYSAYCPNCFDRLEITPLPSTTAVTRVDALDSAISYEGALRFVTMGSFTLHNRTAAELESGGSLTMDFSGESAALIAKAEDAEVTVTVDGKALLDRKALNCSTARSAVWHCCGLDGGSHRLEVTVHSGKLILDSVEYA